MTGERRPKNVDPNVVRSWFDFDLGTAVPKIGVQFRLNDLC